VEGKMGLGKTVNWPASSIGQKGNPGVAGFVTQTPGQWAMWNSSMPCRNKMAFASIKNKSGNFIEPSTKSASNAAKVIYLTIRTSLSQTPTPRTGTPYAASPG